MTKQELLHEYDLLMKDVSFRIYITQGNLDMLIQEFDAKEAMFLKQHNLENILDLVREEEIKG